MKYFIPLIVILSGIGFLSNFNDMNPAKKKESMFGILNRMKSVEPEWITLNNVDQISDIISSSRKKPILIYKHSTSCGISHMAKSRLNNDWDDIKDKVTLYYLDLLAYRSVSNEVARIFNVTHQSPQLILVVDGRVVSSWSHYDVSVKSVLKKI